jgi:hypothetical protein
MTRTALKSPAVLMNRFFDSSDWIRYGTLAVILTVLFYFLVRQPSPNNVSISRTANLQRKITVLTPRIKSEIANPSAAQAPHAMPAAPGIANPLQRSLSRPLVARIQPNGRLAVCSAVKAALPDLRAGKLRRHQAIRLAHQAYRGPQAPADAVSQALTEYNSGAWSEADCPAGDNLPKGAIAEVMQLGHNP